MTLLYIVLAAIFICFVFVLAFGAPYLPTLKPQIQTIIELADLKVGDVLIDLGCGDGRILIAAAKKGINSVGYELNPIMFAIAYIRTRKYKHKATVIWGDYWRKDWPNARVIFVFLGSKYMKKLDKKCVQYPHKPLKVISYAFQIPGKKPLKTKNALFVYSYK